MTTNITTQKLCNWFIQNAVAHSEALTPVKLNHLVILSGWWYRHRHGEALMQESAEAWPQGPVLPSLYHEYKDQPPTAAIENPSRRQPPLEEDCDVIPFLEHIWSMYGKYTAKQLSRINTSDRSPWGQALAKQGEPVRQTITEQHIAAYFQSLEI